MQVAPRSPRDGRSSPQSRGHAPAGALELDLERLEDVAHERAGRAPGARAGPGVRVRSIAAKDGPPRLRASRAGVARRPGRAQRWTPAVNRGWASTMIRISVMSSIAQRRPSRPRPESFTPP